MSKAYSNKALPAGTILREWRLEQVLGVGGFGIVYRGRGIYFNELVAIKEYFPSAISDRAQDATVIPIDSAVEDVHAFGLKKFVEEAKLLWHLSTPERHPNIVNVRSLFEIHGTAYMVMDFENGTALSTLLKQGRQFDEASLMQVIRPIAEGLDRAHQVGVLHRDIKPPNILINDDGRAVLIDFGSARLETGEATSTRVNFHTPPYAALEQYVKSYQQGPFTDIYALGAVMYECITGEKPPEVLERMHGGLGKPLTLDEHPGYSPAFLAAVDAAMAIKPSERPQSISEWLAQFPPSPAPPVSEGEDIAEAQSGAVHNTDGSDAPQADYPADLPAAPADRSQGKGKRKLLLLGGVVAVAAAAGAGAWYMAGGSKAQPDAALLTDAPTGAPVNPAASAMQGRVATAVQDLATDAARSDAPQEAVEVLTLAATQLTSLDTDLRQMLADPAQAAAASAREAEMAQIARTAAARFAAAILQDADSRMARLVRDLPWADPRNPRNAAGTSADQREKAADVRAALTRLRGAVAQARDAADPNEALGFARQAMALNRGLAGSVTRAYRATGTVAVTSIPYAAPGAITNNSGSTSAQNAAPPQVVVPGNDRATDTQRRQLKSALDNARDVSKQVIRLGPRNRPGSNASEAKQDAYRRRQANMNTARDYERYLDTLENSMRGSRTRAEADQLIAQAHQTRGYLNQLLAESRASLD